MQIRSCAMALLVGLWCAVAATAAEGPAWPHLRDLDTVAGQAAGLAEKLDAAALRDLAPTLRAAVEAVAADAVPDQALRSNDVVTLQRDLRTLAAELKNVHQLSDPQLVDLAEGVHPIVAALFTAAGIPLVTAPESEPGQEPAPELAPDSPPASEDPVEGEAPADAPLT